MWMSRLAPCPSAKPRGSSSCFLYDLAFNSTSLFIAFDVTVGLVVLIFKGFIPMDEVQGVKHGKDEQVRQHWDGPLCLCALVAAPGRCGAAGVSPAFAKPWSEAPFLWSPPCSCSR